MTRGQKLNIKIMKNLLKKINVFGLAVVLVCGVIFTTQSAFKGVAKLDPPADGWFEVTVIDPLLSHSDPTNLEIGIRIDEPEEEDAEGCARTGNDGDFCAVLLNFTENATVVPAKISDVNSEFETIDDDAQQPE
jgi:hypothetical protein